MVHSRDLYIIVNGKVKTVLIKPDDRISCGVETFFFPISDGGEAVALALSGESSISIVKRFIAIVTTLLQTQFVPLFPM